VPVSSAHRCHDSVSRHDTTVQGDHAVYVIWPKSLTGSPVKLFAVMSSSEKDGLSRAHAICCDWSGAS